MSVNLVIRDPSSRHPDLSLTVGLDKNIGDVKLLISQQHPLQPLPQSQRLVFAGRLLQEPEKLSTILQHFDTTNSPTFHLVIRTNLAPPSPPPQAPPVQQNAPPFAQNAQFGFRFGPNQPPHYQFNPANLPPNFMGQPGFPNQFQQQQFAAAQAQQQNANGQALWLLVKLAFFVYLFSQGSTTRIIFLSCVALVIYLYQTGRLRVVAQVYMPPPRGAAPQQPRNPNEGDQQGDAPQNGASPAPQQTQPHRPNGVIEELTAFVVHFFLSLVPTYQPVQHV